MIPIPVIEMTDHQFLEEFTAYLKKWITNISDSDIARFDFYNDMRAFKSESFIRVCFSEATSTEITSMRGWWLFLWKDDIDCPPWGHEVNEDATYLFNKMIQLNELKEVNESPRIHIKLTDDQFDDIINFIEALDEAMSL